MFMDLSILEILNVSPNRAAETKGGLNTYVVICGGKR